MLHKYSDFIVNESMTSNPRPIYWKRQLDEISEKEWTSFEIRRVGEYKTIMFELGDSRYSFLYDRNESLLIEDNLNQDTVKNKIKTEFWKNAQEYVKNLKFKPSFLGDLDMAIDSNKYNM